MIAKEILDDILFLCSRGEFKESKKVDAAGFEGVLGGLKGDRFTGALSLAYKTDDTIVSDWIVLDAGEVRVSFVEEDIKARGGEKRISEPVARDGYLETFVLSEVQMDEIRRLIGSTCVPGTAPRPAPKPMPKPVQRPAPPPSLAPEPTPGSTPEHASVPGPAPESEEGPLVRDDVLKKYRLKEPTEAYVEGILKGYREPTQEDMVRCRNMLGVLQANLKEMFGDQMATLMFERQFKDLAIDKEYMTGRDVGKLLEAFHDNVLEKFVGPENAERAMKKLKRRLMPKNM